MKFILPPFYGVPSLGHKKRPAAGGPSAEVTQFLARTSGLDSTHIDAYTALIDGIVADGEWAGLDGLWIGATDTQAHSYLNLKEDTGTYDLTVDGAGGDLTHTPDEGWNQINTTILDTGYAIGDGNAVQNSTAIGYYNRTSSTATDTTVAMGLSGATYCSIIMNQGGTTFADVNDANFAGVAAINHQGMWVASRTAASGSPGGLDALNAYRNSSGTAVISSTGASATSNSDTLYILGANNAGAKIRLTADQIAAAFISSGLTSAAAVRLSNRINTYMAAVGADVY